MHLVIRINTTKSIICFNLSLIIGCIVHFVALLPASLKYWSYMSSLIIGIMGLFFYYFDKQANAKRNNALNIWYVISFFMIFVGLLFGLPSIKSNFGVYVSQDLRYIVYFAIALAYSDVAYLKYYKKTMNMIAFIGIIACVVGLFFYDFSYSLLSEGARIGIWSVPYYCWWISGAVFQYVFLYAIATDNDKFLGYASFIAYSILGILFLKRSAFINIVLTIIASFLVQSPTQRKQQGVIRRNRFIIVGLLIILLIIVIVNTPYFRLAINQTIGRFNFSAFTSYDRAREADYYFSQTPFYSILLGNGLGNYFNYSGKIVNALHIGAYDVIYKGGIVYAAFWLYIAFLSVKAFIHRKINTQHMNVFVMICLLTLVAMIYEKSFTYTIEPIGFATAIGVIINSNKSIQYNDI